MESIEKFLRNLGQERFIEIFLDNELDIDILKSLSEDELKETLKELNLPLGPRMKILKGVQSLKGEGEWRLIFSSAVLKPSKLLRHCFMLSVMSTATHHNGRTCTFLVNNCLILFVPFNNMSPICVSIFCEGL